MSLVSMKLLTTMTQMQFRLSEFYVTSILHIWWIKMQSLFIPLTSSSGTKCFLNEHEDID